jgi:hypothetical protein
MTNAMTTRIEGPAPEIDIARDLARRALPVAPIFLVVSAVFWGVGGALSAGYAIGLVVLNFLLAAAIMAWAARISLGVLFGAVLGGYILRLALITAAFFLVKDFAWFEVLPFAFTLVITHLGLLTWETRYVSVSLAHPGLQPRPGELNKEMHQT